MKTVRKNLVLVGISVLLTGCFTDEPTGGESSGSGGSSEGSSSGGSSQITRCTTESQVDHDYRLGGEIVGSGCVVGENFYGQMFQVEESKRITAIDLEVWVHGSASSTNIQVEIRSDIQAGDHSTCDQDDHCPSNQTLARSETIESTQISNRTDNGSFTHFELNQPVYLETGKNYWFVIKIVRRDLGGHLNVKYHENNQYRDGRVSVFYDRVQVWRGQWNSARNWDFNFRTYTCN